MRSHLIVSHYLNRSYAHFCNLGQTGTKWVPLWLLVPNSPKYCKFYWLYYWFSWKIFTLYAFCWKRPLLCNCFTNWFWSCSKMCKCFDIKLYYVLWHYVILFFIKFWCQKHIGENVKISLKKLSFYKISNSNISRMAWPILKGNPFWKSERLFFQVSIIVISQDCQKKFN